MGDMLELIFSNFLVVAAVIGGIISFFSGVNKKKEGTGSSAAPSSMPPEPVSTPESTVKKVSDRADENLPDSQTLTRDYNNEKQKRQKELREFQKSRGQDLTSSLQSPIGTLDDPEGLQVDHGSQKKRTIQYSRYWDKQKLADGIIMSEILGAPRAYRPHRSNPRKR